MSQSWLSRLLGKNLSRSQQRATGDREQHGYDLGSIPPGRRSAVVTVRHLHAFEAHTGYVWAIAVSPDGGYALSGGSDGSLRLWDLAAAQCVSTLGSHTGDVRSTTVSADGRLALSGGSDCSVKVWDLAARQCLSALDGHTDAVMATALSADGRFALSGGQDCTVRLWDVATGRCIRVLKGHTCGVLAIAIAPDACLALSGGGDTTIRIWELATGNCLRVLTGHAGGIHSVVALTADGSVAREFAVGGVCSLTFTGDGRLALSCGSDGVVKVWDPFTGRCVRTLQRWWAKYLRALWPSFRLDNARSVAVTADGRLAVSGSDDNTLKVWDIATGRCLHVLRGHAGTVESVALTPDGHTALSCSRDGTIRLWQLRWNYEFAEPSDWDEGARSFLKTFLTLHAPYAAALPQGREPSEEEIRQALTRRGRPSWTEDDFQGLIRELQHADYGWLRPEGVRAELERMARDCGEPPPSDSG